MTFDRPTRRLGTAVLGVCVLGAAAATLSANPAAAASIVTAFTTVSCSLTGANWCISGNNTSSGIGVIGTSNTGTGLRGVSTSQFGLNATSGSGTAISAHTTSGPYAIQAQAGSGGIGVSGLGKTGVFGYAATGRGIDGETYSGLGVYGSSQYGDGIHGYAYTGTGVFGTSTSSGNGVQGSSLTGNGGYFSSPLGYGVFANTTGGVAFVGRTANGNASDIQGSNIGLLGRAPTTGFPLVLTDATPNTLLQVDGYGNLAITGNYEHLRPTTNGGQARSFSPSATQPTIEDTGTAQLISGVGVVRLDPTFAASIDRTTAYRVFVTPAGDTRGLFVANRTPAGFVVRESQAGRSTVAFDYRVVATALGQTGQRMASINSTTHSWLVKAPLPLLRPAAVSPAINVPTPRP